MIIYGYAGDRKNMPEEIDDELYRIDCKTDLVSWVTCYSVSAYEPTAMVFGIPLSKQSCMFNPIKLNGLRTEPTEEEIKTLQVKFDILSDEAKRFFNTEPAVYLLEEDDD